MTQELKNIGPVSWRALNAVGIADVEALRRVGAVAAYILVHDAKGGASLNFLYAMTAGLDGRHWCEVSAEEKGRLLREVADVRESRSLMRP